MIPTTTARTFRRVMITLRMNPAKRTRIISPIMIISAPIMADLCTPSSVYLDIYAKMSSEHIRVKIGDLEQGPQYLLEAAVLPGVSLPYSARPPVILLSNCHKGWHE